MEVFRDPVTYLMHNWKFRWVRVWDTEADLIRISDSPAAVSRCDEVDRPSQDNTAPFARNQSEALEPSKNLRNGELLQERIIRHAAANSGHYTPVIAATGAFPSVVYDSTTQQYLIAYAAANHTSITMQHGSSLLSWSGPTSAGVLTDGNNALLYPTLVGEGSDPTTSSGEPWLFYLDATTWPDWSAATIMNRRVQLSLQ